MEAHQTSNLGVLGSSPSRVGKIFLFFDATFLKPIFIQQLEAFIQEIFKKGLFV
jgi:hypothetical protein